MLTVLINGEEKTLKQPMSMDDLLKTYQIEPSAVVVEYNEAVLPRQCFAETMVSPGDKIEIVRFVGGGV